MPRVNRRAVRSGLLLIRRVPENVVKRAVFCAGAEEEFTNRIAHTIPRIIQLSIFQFRITGSVRIAGVRRFRHPYPQKSYRHGSVAQANRLSLTFSIRNRSLRKGLPDSARHGLDGVVARPVLDHIVSGVRFRSEEHTSELQS